MTRCSSVNIFLFIVLFENTSGKVITKPVHDSPVNNSKKENWEIVNELLHPHRQYDAKIRPLGQNGSGPVLVYLNIYLRSIESIDDVRMEYTVQFTYRQCWRDHRLLYSHSTNLPSGQRGHNYIHLVNESKIWTPDVFFANEKRGMMHKLIRRNIFTRIFPNGDVLQSYRFTLLLSCPMNLRAYPLDTQKCPLQMRTYGYSTRDIILEWSQQVSPIEHKVFQLPQFNIISYATKRCLSLTAVDRFSCLELEIELERAFGFYLIQIYIPCAMLVMVSWVSFWFEPTAVEARVSLGVTTILTIVTQTYGINQNAPPSSYIKALDIWTAFCQIQIFGGLLQFALVNYTAKLTSPTLKRLHNLYLQPTSEEMIDDEDDVLEEEKLKVLIGKAKRIDKISRILFPTVFFLFNCVYWTSYILLF